MKQKKTIEERVQAEFPEFFSEMAGLSKEKLKNRLAKLAEDAEVSEQAKETDEALNAAKDSVKNLSEPYREFKKAVRLKTQYLVHLLRVK